MESISLSVKRVERNDKIVAYYGTCFIFSNHGDIAFEDHCLIFIAFEDNYLISKKEQLIEVLSTFILYLRDIKMDLKLYIHLFFCRNSILMIEVSDFMPYIKHHCEKSTERSPAIN